MLPENYDAQIDAHSCYLNVETYPNSVEHCQKHFIWIEHDRVHLFRSSTVETYLASVEHGRAHFFSLEQSFNLHNFGHKL